ncbi:GtrA family protein [Aureimonas altamirensis]|uniref:GtrA family protein n=1 Tax=Aureimonas altamirensis TaxID=370622 RepID=UPI0020369684|nr:GtrA family protein [Aureimonas altamirensis]MCM2504557.1 GtrA family protein [Aureimonas altamirensis]
MTIDDNRSAPRTGLWLMARYALVGVLNTIIHWAIFGALVALGTSQAEANVLAFCAAVTVSFFANARLTFRRSATAGRYVLFVAFMGTVAFGTGWAGDRSGLNPLLTLATFSFFSLFAGFAYSRFIVFGIKP